MKHLNNVLIAATLGGLTVAAQAQQMPQAPVHGYSFGSPLAQTPYTLAELRPLQKTLLFSENDVAALNSKAILADQTDGVNSVPQVNFRYAPALTIPITTTLKPFLAKKGASASEVDKMQAAWVKAVLLQSILWNQPYVK